MIVAFVFSAQFSQAQYSTQAHLWIDTLTSSDFNGRGYSDSADKKLQHTSANIFLLLD